MLLTLPPAYFDPLPDTMEMSAASDTVTNTMATFTISCKATYTRPSGEDVKIQMGVKCCEFQLSTL